MQAATNFNDEYNANRIIVTLEENNICSELLFKEINILNKFFQL